MFRLTTPDELTEVLGGQPLYKRIGHDGDSQTLVLEYPNIEAGFGRMSEPPGVFTLYWIKADGKQLDIGRGGQLVLRDERDLEKLDSFWGCTGVSLARLDLATHGKLLNRLTFDSTTIWPPGPRLPKGFDPARLLDEGRNPGLGVRRLHSEGIDGRGVGLAIIDQPLLREHAEYQAALIRYEPVDVDGVPPQMHGSPVASIAVGKTCGVAPGAALYYFAAPMWKWTENTPAADLLERIIKLNQELKDTPKIRVVSISLGAFSQRTNYARWQRATEQANQAGILVVTCDPEFLRIGTLKRMENRSGEKPDDYERGRYAAFPATVWVPAANRSMASFKGTEIYTYDRQGGMSWTVPYLAGLAALGWQVDPSLKPGEIIELWQNTATKTATGPVVNPGEFITAIKSRKQGT